MTEGLSEILTPYRGQRGALIPVLQQVQEKLGYLPEEAITEIASFLGLGKSEVYGVASFYAQFRFERQGEHVVKVCQGTACYVQGAKRILETVEEELHLAPGQTTTGDYKFSVERVACFGCCALAPVMVVDDVVNAKMTIEKTKKILTKYR